MILPIENLGKMKQVDICKPRSVKLMEVPVPEPFKDWALVKIHSAPMCTEYKSYVAGEMPPYPLGHEAAGEVVALDESGSLKVGDRVVVMPQYPCGHCSLCLKGDYIYCEHSHTIKEFTGRPEGDSTFAQFILKPIWLLPKIPDGMSYDHAAMLCCGLGPTFGAMGRMNVGSSDTILITGMGPVGLGGRGGSACCRRLDRGPGSCALLRIAGCVGRREAGPPLVG